MNVREKFFSLKFIVFDFFVFYCLFYIIFFISTKNLEKNLAYIKFYQGTKTQFTIEKKFETAPITRIIVGAS